jgi:hypothetical protein
MDKKDNKNLNWKNPKPKFGTDKIKFWIEKYLKKFDSGLTYKIFLNQIWIDSKISISFLLV